VVWTDLIHWITISRSKTNGYAVLISAAEFRSYGSGGSARGAAAKHIGDQFPAAALLDGLPEFGVSGVPRFKSIGVWPGTISTTWLIHQCT